MMGSHHLANGSPVQRGGLPPLNGPCWHRAPSEFVHSRTSSGGVKVYSVAASGNNTRIKQDADTRLRVHDDEPYSLS